MLDEPTWANATLVTDLHQLDPVEFAPPSQRSEIRLYYDDDALYVAARLWDTEADRITAQVLRQGEGLASEDRFSVILDPYLDRRNGYRFQVNPNGVRWEALYQDTSNLESNWDGIWLGAATRDERRLDRRDGDPVQDAVVQSEQQRLGHQLRAHDPAQRRDAWVGVAQSADESRRRRHGDAASRA